MPIVVRAAPETEPPDLTAKLELIVAPLQAALQGIKSLECTSDVKLTYSDLFKKYNPKSFLLQNDGTSATVDFKASGSDFLYTMTPKDRNGNSLPPFTGGFSGQRTSFIDKSDGEMRVKSGFDRTPNGMIDGEIGILEPFSFLVDDPNKINEAYITLNDVSTGVLWKTFLNQCISLSTVTLNGVPCVEIIRKGANNFEDRVWLKQFDGLYFPVRLERRDESQNLIRIVEITKTQPILVDTPAGKLSLQFPSNIHTTCYEHGGFEICSFDHQISKIALNVPMDPSSFSIDPASAKKVWDDNAKVWIHLDK
jgi:hypothetical protein